MSDPKSSYGEPVEEPTAVDDVVGRAQEGLADAEAAGSAAVVEETVVVEPDPADDAPSAANEWAAEPPSWASDPVIDTPHDDAPTVVAEPVVVESATVAYDAPTTAYDPVVAPSEPVVADVPVVAASPSPQPIFVQAPEAPRPRGNRAAAGAIGLLAALCFAVLYLAAWLGFGAIAGDVTAANVGSAALTALGTWTLWVPTVVFFIAFWLLGAIINRGRWGAWVIVGLLVGVASYGGHLLGALFQAPFWLRTASEGAEIVEGQLLAPLAIAAFVFGRELTIWFGAWAAARGRRVTEVNVEAQREYERTLEAGPQLVRQ
ncbi:MAG: ABC transporter [Microbacterium sp.]